MTAWPVWSIVLFCCLLSSASGFAQRTAFMQVDSSLRPANPLPVRSIFVLDGRSDTTGVGYLKTGAFNRFAFLQVEGGLAPGLERYLHFITDEKLAGEDDLLLVIRQFLLQDMQKNEEIATVRLQAEVYKGRNGAYRRYLSVDSFCELKSSWDVSDRMQKTACAVLLGIVADGASARVQPLSEQTYSASEALYFQRNFRAALPAYSTGNMRRGIYRSYEDFLQLRSVDTDFIDRRMVGGTLPPVITFHLKNDRGKRGTEVSSADCYAVCDGKRWYYALKSGYRDMRWDGSNYYVKMNLRGMVDHRADIIAGGVAFGAIGASIAAGSGKNEGVVTYEVQLMPEDGDWHLVRRIVKP